MSENQQQNVQKLSDDLKAIQSGSQATPEQKQAVADSLMAMADGATRPDQALVQSLANNLTEAMADGSLSQAEKAKLSKDLQKVMNSANIPPAEVQAAIASIQTLLTASGVDRQDVQTIVNDLKAIAGEAKTNATSRPRFRRG